MDKPTKIIISGGGTGGHIYPAIAIANELKARMPDAKFLFVGANDRMEMQKVPKAGYNIRGLWISGINRSNMLSNLKFPFKLISSIREAKKIFKEFQPDVAIGTGGYASGPMLWVAAKKGIPILIQEQNSFPGITNKLLKNKASKICVAYDGIQQFPKEKVVLTGNPIRSELFTNLPEQKQAKKSFGLDENKTTILSVGGSLGSRTMNNAWLHNLENIKNSDVQLIWQTGKLEYEKLSKNEELKHPNIHLTEFIYNMQDAYAAADIIVSRAGAMAISELCLVGKACILLPFPYASEDHQTKNAQSLVNENAAIMIKDEHANADLWQNVENLIKNEEKRNTMATNIKRLGKPNATKEIADLVMELMN